MQFEDGPPGTDLAGHESTRKSLSGSPSVIRLGARLLPQLASGDLHLEPPDQLDVLRADCQLILDHLAQVAMSTGLDPEYIAYRVTNIRTAVDRARTLNGGVVVW